MQDLDFKKASIEDWQLVEYLEKGAASEYFYPCEGEEGYKKYIKESTVYFIVQNKIPIGTISYKIENDGKVFINGLTVLPKYRGQKIGTTAMHKLLSDLGENIYALFVHPANTAALIIYLRLGFTIKDWKNNHFGNGQPRLYLERKNNRIIYSNSSDST